MDTLVAGALPLQLVPEFGLPGILSTLVIIVLAIVVARVVLSIALKVAVVAAVVVGLLWFFGLLRFVPFL
ncbi:hypothetical protein [Halosegnis marinus]|uniref:Uncharacterized protein n=1 Tax=Halosegnis marinus TaxID=3034023 RepID=A0ABD5ZLG7_9EURY|nr:hypothetical protein [Halosegnis sp. DT85]